jgi:hypothetical protein
MPYTKPEIDLVRRRNLGLRVERVVQLKGRLNRIRLGLSCHQPNFVSRRTVHSPYRPELQEPHRIQGLLDVWHLILQTGYPPLQVLLHELILPKPRPSQHQYQPCCRNWVSSLDPTPNEKSLTQSALGIAAASAQHRPATTHSPRPCRRTAHTECRGGLRG